MATEYKEFKSGEGSGPTVTVIITERDDVLDRESKVQINWSCMGALPVKDARDFYNAFGEALGWAHYHATRLGVRIG